MKSKLVFAALAIFALVFAACSGDKPEANSTSELNASSVEGDAAAVSATQSEAGGSQDSAPDAGKTGRQPRASITHKLIQMSDAGSSYLITDSLGQASVVKNPAKVVIFDTGVIDTFDSLGLGDKIIGVPVKNLPDYLAKFKNKPNMGGVNQVDFEALNAAKPDLIIISGRLAKYYDKLKEIAPTIFVGLDTANYLASFQNNVLSIAKLYGLEEEANKQIADIKAQIEQVAAGVDKNKRGLIVLTNANKISAFGPGSRFGLIHDVLGITPADDAIKVGTHGNSINAEYILEKNPDYIFVVDRNVIVGNKERAQGILNNALIAKTKAAQTGKIIYLTPQFWYLAGGNGIQTLKGMIAEVGAAVKN